MSEIYAVLILRSPERLLDSTITYYAMPERFSVCLGAGSKSALTGIGTSQHRPNALTAATGSPPYAPSE